MALSAANFMYNTTQAFANALKIVEGTFEHEFVKSVMQYIFDSNKENEQLRAELQEAKSHIAYLEGRSDQQQVQTAPARKQLTNNCSSANCPNGPKAHASVHKNCIAAPPKST